MHWDPKKRLNRYLKISLLFHGLLFLAMIASSFVFPHQSMLFLPSVQIDMVALPDLVKNQEAPTPDLSLPVKENAPPPPPPAKAEPDEMKAPAEKAEKSPVPEKKLKEDAKNALERLREMQKKKTAKEAQKEREELLTERQKELKRFEETYRSAIRGNQKNEGTSSTGDLQTAVNAYAGHIREKLNSNWALPVYLQSKGLRAVVRMYIDGKGNILRYQFTEPSGNDVFDNNVKGALQRSTPFAPPPEEMAKGLRNSGIEVQFPL